jgi:hypothetical protein
MPVSKRVAILAAAALVSAPVALTAIAKGGNEVHGPPGAQTPAASPPGSEPPVPVVGEVVGRRVAALRQPRTAEDALPADIAKYVDWASLEGANGRLAQKALSRDGQVVFLLPGHGVVCLLLTGTSGGANGPSCRTPEQLHSETGGPGALGLECSGGSDAELPTCEGTRLVGIAPDGISRVSVPLASGGSVSSRIVNNAYLIDVPGRPSEIRLEGHAGTIRQRVP